MKPKTELFLRQAARASCLVGAGIALAGMLGQTLVLLLNNPAFVLFLKILLAIAVGLVAVYFFLWAIGQENRDRIDELRRICQDDRR